MENRVIVAAFDNQDAAFEAAQDAQDLERSGVIKIKRGAILTRDANGNLTIPDSKYGSSSWGTLGGGVIGTLIGSLKASLLGPAGAGVAGALGGAAAGLTVGAAGDALSDDIRDDQIDASLQDAISAIEPGQTVLLAELEEGSTESIAAALTPRGGRVFRTNLEVTSKVEQVRRRVQREVAARRAKIDAKIEHDIEADEEQAAWENEILEENDIKVGRLMTINQQSEYNVYSESRGPASTRPVDDRLP